MATAIVQECRQRLDTNSLRAVTTLLSTFISVVAGTHHLTADFKLCWLTLLNRVTLQQPLMFRQSVPNNSKTISWEESSRQEHKYREAENVYKSFWDWRKDNQQRWTKIWEINQREYLAALALQSVLIFHFVWSKSFENHPLRLSTSLENLLRRHLLWLNSIVRALNATWFMGGNWT